MVDELLRRDILEEDTVRALVRPSVDETLRAGGLALLAAAAAADAPDVAAWRRVGGAVAIAFAFARLAAIAAATDDFFATGAFTSVDVLAPGGAPGLAFSSCFRATLSKLSMMAAAFVGHSRSNIQNDRRDFSFTTGFGSVKPLRRILSR